jgi:hypothetical protein
LNLTLIDLYGHGTAILAKEQSAVSQLLNVLLVHYHFRGNSIQERIDSLLLTCNEQLATKGLKIGNLGSAYASIPDTNQNQYQQSNALGFSGSLQNGRWRGIVYIV